MIMIIACDSSEPVIVIVICHCEHNNKEKLENDREAWILWLSTKRFISENRVNVNGSHANMICDYVNYVMLRNEYSPQNRLGSSLFFLK